MLVEIDELSDYATTFIEFSVFTHFFLQVIKGVQRKKVIKICFILFAIFFLYCFITDENFYRSVSSDTQNRVYTIESLFISIFSVFYFFELFKNLPAVRLGNEPSFWVATGIFFFNFCTLPFSLMESYFASENHSLASKLYAIFYIFYILMMFMIIRGYSCKMAKRV